MCNPNYPHAGYVPCPVFQDRPLVPDAVGANGSQTPHAGGMNVCLGDGSVRVVNSGISPATWAAACDPRDGVPLGGDW